MKINFDAEWQKQLFDSNKYPFERLNYHLFGDGSMNHSELPSKFEPLDQNVAWSIAGLTSFGAAGFRSLSYAGSSGSQNQHRE